MAKRNAKQEILNRRKKAAAKEKKDATERRAGIQKQLKSKRKPKQHNLINLSKLIHYEQITLISKLIVDIYFICLEIAKL